MARARVGGLYLSWSLRHMKVSEILSYQAVARTTVDVSKLWCGGLKIGG